LTYTAVQETVQLFIFCVLESFAEAAKVAKVAEVGKVPRFPGLARFTQFVKLA
jgi:hypothetical protein